MSDAAETEAEQASVERDTRESSGLLFRGFRVNRLISWATRFPHRAIERQKHTWRRSRSYASMRNGGVTVLDPA